MAKLIMLLNEDGRLSDIIRVSQDEEYRQELYEEYHIINTGWQQAEHLQVFCLI